MRLAVVSDLHLGPGRMNRCRVPPRQMVRMLDLIDATHDRVVVAGDLYDLSRPVSPMGWQDHLESMRFEWGDLLARLESYEGVWGNHDRQRATFGVPEFLEYVHAGVRVRIGHGHQFDPMLKRVWGLERGANFAAGWFERLNLSAVSRAMAAAASVDERLEAAVAGGQLGQEGARRWLAEGFDLVIMGHSHELEACALGSGVYANSGSWTNGHAEWVSVDFETRRVQTFRDGAVVNGADLRTG